MKTLDDGESISCFIIADLPKPGSHRIWTPGKLLNLLRRSSNILKHHCRPTKPGFEVLRG